MQNSQEKPIEFHIIFQGNVQGVGFRATTQHLAEKLGLKGTVRNCTDGSVEAYIQGSSYNIQQLLSEIHQKIGHGQISNITQREISPLNTYKNFQITY